MGYAALTDFVDAANQLPDEQMLLSFVFPGGCQMRCDYCIIGARKEGFIKGSLTGTDYSYFLMDVCKHHNVHSLYLAGEEVLLNQKVITQFTLPVIRTAQKLGIKIGLVSNGLTLAQHAEWLAATSVEKIVVSLDGVGEFNHRRVDAKGDSTYERVTDNIEASLPFLRERMVIGTVYDGFNMKGLPELFEQVNTWGISKVVLSAPIGISTGKSGYVKGNSDQMIHFLDMENVIIDDELNMISFDDKKVIARKPHVNIVRLSPDGSICANDDILKEIDDRMGVYDPKYDDPSAVVEGAISASKYGQLSALSNQAALAYMGGMGRS